MHNPDIVSQTCVHSRNKSDETRGGWNDIIYETVVQCTCMGHTTLC